MNKINDEWLTVRDASIMSGYNEEHLTRLLRQGKLKGKKVSVVWLVDRESLLAYTASRKHSHNNPQRVV